VHGVGESSELGGELRMPDRLSSVAYFLIT